MRTVVGVDEVLGDLTHLSKDFPLQFVKKATQRLHSFATARASKHSKTGLMENNISLDVQGLVGSVFIENNPRMIRNGTNYAIFVHFGTRQHKILPRNKKALRWSSGGVFAFAKGVKHPGYKGDPFMYDALNDTEKIFNKIKEEVLNDTIY